jgi:hypothetical protein
MNEEDTDEPEVVGIPGYYNKLEPVAATPDTLQSVPTCTCSKHPLWDGYDGDCPIHGWFEPVAPDTPQSVPAKTAYWKADGIQEIVEHATPDAPLSQGEEYAGVSRAALEFADWWGENYQRLTETLNEQGIAMAAWEAARREIEAERDRLFQKLGAMTVERDKLKEQRDKWCKAYEDCANEHKALVERVGELERALGEIASFKHVGMKATQMMTTIARAALRTSEDA